MTASSTRTKKVFANMAINACHSFLGDLTDAQERFAYRANQAEQKREPSHLCIQRLDTAANNAIILAFGWDPTEPVATRPLILQKYGQYNLFYTHDGNKNVSELVFFQQANGIAAHYEYAPFGAVTATSRSTPVTAYDFRDHNPFRSSSEYADDSLGLVYYNYRHYNPMDGWWISRDKINSGSINLYLFCDNDANNKIDIIGLSRVIITDVCGKEEILEDPSLESFKYAISKYNDSCIKDITIYDHGWIGFMGIDGSEDGMVVAENGKVLFTDDQSSVSDLLGRVLMDDSSILLSGCLTAYDGLFSSSASTNIAQALSVELPDTTVKGNRGFAIGPRFAPTINIGIRRSYKNGKEN